MKLNLTKDWYERRIENEGQQVTTDQNDNRHTPGPWRYDSGVFYAECQLDENGTTYERPIAEMLEGRPSNTKANARLIAAAPEMFELLETLEISHGTIQPSDWNRINEVIKQVKGNQ